MGEELQEDLGGMIGEEARGKEGRRGRGLILFQYKYLPAFYLCARFAFAYEVGLHFARAAVAATEVQGFFGKLDFFPRF